MSKKKSKRLVKSGLPPETLVYTGDRELTPSLCRTIKYNSGLCEVQEEYAPERDAEHKIWVDVRNISDVEFVRKVGEKFEIHPLALEDVLNTQQRAKMEEYDNGIFVVLPNIHFNEEWNELHFEQISMFVAYDTLITFQEDPDDTLLAVAQRMQESNGKIRKKGTDYLAYAVIDSIIDNYFVALSEIETAIIEIENSIYQDNMERHFKSKIFMFKHVLNQFKHKVQPLREAVARLNRTESPFMQDADMVYLRDVADHVAQILDNIDSYRDQLVNSEALYHNEMSNRMNNVMKLLTVISTIFIPLSFVAGVYGMNFENMPELKWHYGYFIVLGFMFTTMIGMLIYFRKKNWI